MRMQQVEGAEGLSREGAKRSRRTGGNVVSRSQITRASCAWKFLLHPKSSGKPFRDHTAKRQGQVCIPESMSPGSVRSGFKGAILGQEKDR